MRVLLPLIVTSSAFAAVLDLPIWVRNGYSLVEVDVGTPAASHFLLFDTGSSTTWMDDVSCLDTNACPNGSGYRRTGYNASSSSTSEPLNTSAAIDFLGGLTTGNGIMDVFSLSTATVTVNANSSNDTTSLPPFSWTQTFLSANESSWSALAADGFLGLAFSTIADANTTTVAETLMRAGRLDRPRFGLYLGRETNDTGNTAGNGLLTLGGSYEDTHAIGGSQGLNWTSLQTPGKDAQLWRTNMHYAVGHQASGSSDHTITASGSWAVFDTGAGRISVPDPMIDEIYASLGMNWTAIIGGETIPLCDDFTDDWYFDVFVGDSYSPTQLRITGTMLRMPGFATGEDKYCWPPFDTSGSNGLFLFGAQFLQNFYTVFDFGGFDPDSYNARIGFGNLKDEYKPVV